jgi:FkbM family methyltransferase
MKLFELLSQVRRLLGTSDQDCAKRVATLRRDFAAKRIVHNQFYDALTEMVIRTVCRSGDCCVDVGCHRGSILDAMIAAAPDGTFYGFEPLPDLYAQLVQKYQDHARVQISPIALSDQQQTTQFQFVRSNPAYSGFRQRRYDRPDETIETIDVNTDRLDNLLAEEQSVRLIKIDVEGAELLVMRGAERILNSYQPFVIFEHARGGVKFYEYGPRELHDFICGNCSLSISTLDGWLLNEPPLDLPNFVETFDVCRHYYFVAHPR